MTAEFGVVGLGTMGRNISLNIAETGARLAVYNRTEDKIKDLIASAPAGVEIEPAYTLPDLVEELERPRRILLMVPAGDPVDSVLDQLAPHLTRGDVVIDGGNSHFKETERRGAELEQRGIQYVGMGISGGSEGARHGPCLMPGGPRDAYELCRRTFRDIAAKVDGDPCVVYIGTRGAGHLVKMVHNGIEYAIMQVLAEAYDTQTLGLGLSVDESREVFKRWSNGELSSYLLEITVKVLAKREGETGRPLIKYILDAAQQKGTGRWTAQTAMDLGVPTPTIAAAVIARTLSSYKEDRLRGGAHLSGPRGEIDADREGFLRSLRDAVYASVLTSYVQGLNMIHAGSQEFDYGVSLEDVTRIWRGGCIIRADLLEDLRRIYAKEPEATNLMLTDEVASTLNQREDDWRQVVTTLKKAGLPCPGMSSALDYFDSYRREELPANLIQGLRDLFGEHGYRRKDKPGTFHTDWD